ncbi:MAG: virulence factor family protein [Nitrospirae bacterium]|nr:virulence factor family protein [Nitrospirota bacterium]
MNPASAIAFVLLFLFLAAGSSIASETTLNYSRFGKVTLYQQSEHPSHVVLFISGDGGWNLGVVDMARELASLDALVIGIDIIHYLKELEASSEKCSYPAADFEALSKFVQKKLDFPRYIQPLLIGYSSGATLVYAILVQAPPNTFSGAISLGFCPDLPLTKPMCKGNGLEWKQGPHGKGYSFLPSKNLLQKWIAFQGEIDQVCFVKDTEEYVRQVKNGEIVLLPRVGHGYSVPRNWMPQFRKAFSGLVTKHGTAPEAKEEEVKDLPLIEVRAKEDSRDTMAFIITGDGGWASIDREIGELLADNGVSVVGFNSLQYFWARRTPEIAARDMGRVIRHYLTAWEKDSAVLIGYSLGAGVLPFILSRMSPEIAGRVRMAVLLGPGHAVDFEFHLADWLGGAPSSSSLPVLPEVEKLGERKVKVLCFLGEDEKDSICREMKEGLAKIIQIRGGHHFGGNTQAIAENILQEMK